MPSKTLAVKVDAEVADAVKAEAEGVDQTVSDLLRQYVEAIALGERWQLVDNDDELIGWTFLLPRCPRHSVVHRHD